jgi:peptidoglycan hydrolase-like protein with peptidoglycan-binding domain
MVLGFWWAGNLRGSDDFTRDLQSELKRRGYFYAEISGVLTPETATALKRFQIRFGLDATGAVTQETLEALGLGTLNAWRKSRRLDPHPAAPASVPGFGGLPGRVPRPANPVPKAAPGTAEAERPQAAAFYGRLLEGTPYSGAGLEVQRGVVFKALRILERGSFSDGPFNVMPGPGFMAALIGYQNQAGIRLTGRLDLATLCQRLIRLLTVPARLQLRCQQWHALVRQLFVA